jgi:hypothetical protein
MLNLAGRLVVVRKARTDVPEVFELQLITPRASRRILSSASSNAPARSTSFCPKKKNNRDELGHHLTYRNTYRIVTWFGYNWSNLCRVMKNPRNFVTGIWNPWCKNNGIWNQGDTGIRNLQTKGIRNPKGWTSILIAGIESSTRIIWNPPLYYVLCEAKSVTEY